MLGFSTNKERVHTLQCVTGPRAAAARETGIQLVQNLIRANEMVKFHENEITSPEVTGKPLSKSKLLKKLESLKAMVDNRRKRAYKLNGSNPLPFNVSQQALKAIEDMRQRIGECLSVDVRDPERVRTAGLAINIFFPFGLL